ncbi:MAG: GH116 family glycosyl hydrolase, partial [Sedimentisphaerales bacterium]
LLDKGKQFLETELYNGEYFYQKIQTEGLNARFRPLVSSQNGSGYSDIVEMLNTQGPKYQYGTGCLSDGILGCWMARMCDLGEIVDAGKVRSPLEAVYKYNLKHDLSDHANPQRPSFALGKEGGLLLCTWPRGGKLSIPFVYSDEVWTGIEYQVASHLMLEGKVKEGLDIVRVCRDRYDGRIRNPFDEYECGHWYARALSSYGLLQGLTGLRYDAVDKTLYIDSKSGDDFRCFLATQTGFGTAGLKDGKPFVEMKSGDLDVEHVIVSGQEMSL